MYSKELERPLDTIAEEDEEDYTCEISDIEPLGSEKEDTDEPTTEEKQPPRINRGLPAYNRYSLNSTRDLESARKHGLGNLDEDHDDVEHDDLPLPAPGNEVLTADQLQMFQCSSSYKTPAKTPAKKRNRRKEPSSSEQDSSDGEIVIDRRNRKKQKKEKLHTSSYKTPAKTPAKKRNKRKEPSSSEQDSSDEEIVIDRRNRKKQKKEKLHTGVNGIVENERQMFVRRVTIFRDINPPWSDEEKQAIRLLSHRVSQGISTPEVRQFLRDMGFNFGPASVQKIYQKIKTTWRSVKKTFKQGTGN